MSTAYLPVESPFALLPRLGTFLDEVDQEAAAIRHAEIDAAQAVALYRRIEESNSIECQADDDLES